MYTEAVWGFWTLGSIAYVRQKKMGTNLHAWPGLKSQELLHEIINQLLVHVTQLQES